jgi:hypothetical protein
MGEGLAKYLGDKVKKLSFLSLNRKNLWGVTHLLFRTLVINYCFPFSAILIKTKKLPFGTASFYQFKYQVTALMI